MKDSLFLFSLRWDSQSQMRYSFEKDVKGSTASSSNLQNVAFVSENTSSTNDVSTLYDVSNTSGNSKNEQTSTYSLLASQTSLVNISHENKEVLKKTGEKLHFEMQKKPVGQRKITGGGMDGILAIKMGKELKREKRPDGEIDDTQYTYGGGSTKAHQDNPHRTLKNKGIIDSGCSRHMTGNKAYLVTFQDFNLGPVSFESPRQNNMYSFNLENIVPLGGLACLIAKATTDESNKWHWSLVRDFWSLGNLYKAKLFRSEIKRNIHMQTALNWGQGVFQVSRIRTQGGIKDEYKDREVARSCTKCHRVEERTLALDSAGETLSSLSTHGQCMSAINERVKKAESCRQDRCEWSASRQGSYFSARQSRAIHEDDSEIPPLEDSHQDPTEGFQDPKYPEKVYKVVKLCHGLASAPRSASTPIETQKRFSQDEKALMLNVHLIGVVQPTKRRSMSMYDNKGDAYHWSGGAREVIFIMRLTVSPMVSTTFVEQLLETSAKSNNQQYQGKGNQTLKVLRSQSSRSASKTFIKQFQSISETVSLQQRFPRKSFSKKHRMHKKYVSKQGRKIAKGESSVQRDPLFDEMPEETLNHMETKLLKILAEKLQEQEREQFTIEEELIRHQDDELYLKHVGNFKHSELKSKKFEDIQAMYEKIKRSDEDFIAIGSVEDESLIKKMKKKDSSKGEEIKQESKEEVRKSKRKENHKKEKACWKLHSSSGVHTLMTDEGLVVHMLIEKKYPLKKEILVKLLKLKLESKEESTMALELIRFIKKVLADLESKE
ncbi:hypothetical protein Tco_0599231 [Tanacetum coccineum]